MIHRNTNDQPSLLPITRTNNTSEHRVLWPDCTLYSKQNILPYVHSFDAEHGCPYGADVCCTCLGGMYVLWLVIHGTKLTLCGHHQPVLVVSLNM